MGLSEEDQQLVYVSGLVHDIGKIGLPAGLLEKPGALTLDERRQMQDHSEIGERILSKVEDYADIARIVRHHHERVDGHGYPDGIAGEEIPLLSRIIGVADAYDAMTSDRPYREAMPSRVARLRLAQSVESQFDTTIVAAFEAVLAGADETVPRPADATWTSAGSAPDSAAGGGRVTPSVWRHAQRSCRSRRNAELLENVVNVHLDGRLCDEKRISNLRIGHATRNEA